MANEENLTAELTAVLEEIVEETSTGNKNKGLAFEQLSESEFLIDGRQYRLVRDYREGFDAQRLVDRYSEVLARYDYIVGDWGYEQLRLKGFFGKIKNTDEKEQATHIDYQKGQRPSAYSREKSAS